MKMELELGTTNPNLDDGMASTMVSPEGDKPNQNYPNYGEQLTNYAKQIMV
jgi:hypothetical protein